MPIKGLDSLWIVGDEFCSQTCLPFFMNITSDDDSYAKENFETSIFFGTDYMTTSSFEHNANIKNRIARVHNSVVRAIRSKGTLPKLLIIVLEDDIINFLNYNDYGVTEMYGRVIEFLSREINESIQEFKQRYLPTKSKRDSIPQLVWILPTLHRNYRNSNLRRKFANEMEKILPLFPDNTVLRLKQIWDPESNTMVSSFNNALTACGKRFLWKAVDRTIRYADFILFKEKEMYHEQERANLGTSMRNNRWYRNRSWTNPDSTTCRVPPSLRGRKSKRLIYYNSITSLIFILFGNMHRNFSPKEHSFECVAHAL